MKLLRLLLVAKVCVDRISCSHFLSVFVFIQGPSTSPGNITSGRSSDGTEITVSWKPLTLEEARGFYLIRVSLSLDSRKRQGSLTEDVPYTESSVTFTGLEPAAPYTVTTAAMTFNDNGEEVVGESSSPIVAEPNPDHATEAPAPNNIPC